MQTTQSPKAGERTQLWEAARIAEGRMNFAETKLFEARSGILGRITRDGLASYEATAQMFREQYEAAMSAAKGVA